MPDPILAEEINLQLVWAADASRGLASRRLASLIRGAISGRLPYPKMKIPLASSDENIVATRLVHRTDA